MALSLNEQQSGLTKGLCAADQDVNINYSGFALPPKQRIKDRDLAT